MTALALLLAATVQAPDLSGVLALFGQSTMAQACPIGPDKALTNAHVVGDYERFMWSALGQQGPLGAPSTTVKDRFRDLAVVAPYKSTFPRAYLIASAAPEPGSKVWFAGFDFRRKRDAFAQRIFEATIIRVFNGHVVFAPAGVPGTSGSCVLNERGEVVAINMGAKETGDSNVVGMGVGVWGTLLDLGR